jgi:environmental stress-induced protein Ves
MSIHILLNSPDTGLIMRFSASTLQPVPWKNGGGVTRELAQQQRNGQMSWRLSLAEISRDGPFSPFAGFARVHCVVDGAGHVLIGAGDRLEAQPLQPVVFDGEIALDCHLRDGPCSALNLIYNPQHIAVQASVLRSGDWQCGGGKQVLFVAAGSLDLGSNGALFSGEGQVSDHTVSGRVSADGAVIKLEMSPL